jgi:type VI secretion system protein ImpB
MSLNSQHKRVVKNRVSITYDVETNGAVESKELPFVVGVIGDFSAHKTDREEVEDRSFYQVDKDNFDNVMRRVGPELTMKIKNTLSDDDSEFSVSLSFNTMKDFEPDTIVDKVEPLKRLAQTRSQLKTLLSKSDKSRDLEKLLKEVLQSSETISTLSSELGIDTKGVE